MILTVCYFWMLNHLYVKTMMKVCVPIPAPTPSSTSATTILPVSSVDVSYYTVLPTARPCQYIHLHLLRSSHPFLQPNWANYAVDGASFKVTSEWDSTEVYEDGKGGK
jgi:hypothetical protein